MSDIHQEWKELRQKNGDFISHLDGEVAKLEKKQVELKHHEKLQDLVDAGAFAMQFVATPPFNCCADDRDILKALDKAQADRIKYLEDEILACKEQRQVDLAVKKDLDERLDKAAADNKALWVENERLKERVDRANTKIVELTHINGELEELNEEAEKKLKNVMLQLTNSCDAYTKQGMQSKIAKQANEIKRLAHENVGLVIDMKRYRNEIEKLKQGHWDEMERLQNANAKLEHDNFQLKQALGTSAKDAEGNFDRGKINGMQEIWKELVDCYDGRPTGENQKIFGYHTVGDMLLNLSPTWFMNKAEEYRKQREKEALNAQIGDEVQCFDLFCPDDDPHSDIGIVVAIDKDNQCFTVIGPNFEGRFDTTDIQFGTVKMTGRHFDSIPLDYLA